MGDRFDRPADAMRAARERKRDGSMFDRPDRPAIEVALADQSASLAEMVVEARRERDEARGLAGELITAIQVDWLSGSIGLQAALWLDAHDLRPPVEADPVEWSGRPVWAGSVEAETAVLQSRRWREALAKIVRFYRGSPHVRSGGAVAIAVEALGGEDRA